MDDNINIGAEKVWSLHFYLTLKKDAVKVILKLERKKIKNLMIKQKENIYVLFWSLESNSSNTLP